MTESDLPIKKPVSLSWRGATLTLDVAQDLFSSHQVDRGSRLLLDSLDVEAFPVRGTAADFGCGYGVLGIAWQSLLPEWTMWYVDRDALAVAFSRHNVNQLTKPARELARFSCDIFLPYVESGYQLVLWNVPGKIGREVIAGLLDAAVDALAANGVLAVVVVHPLADLFTEGGGRADAVVTLVDRGKEHTVVHIQRSTGVVASREPFGEGLFDRPAHRFAAGDEQWELVPVIGLPEYDSLAHATMVAANAMSSLQNDKAVGRWTVIEPGAGHLAVLASLLWPDAVGEVFGRDALAIKATARAVGSRVALEAATVWGVRELWGRPPSDVIVAALPEQAQADELAVHLAALGGCLAPEGVLVLHGRSTEVSRIERLIRRDARWRARKAEKLRGSAAVAVRRG